MVRVGFDSPENIPQTMEELKRTLGNIQTAYRLEFKSTIVDDRETDNRMTGFMDFNPEKPKQEPQKVYFH